MNAWIVVAIVILIIGLCIVFYPRPSPPADALTDMVRYLTTHHSILYSSMAEDNVIAHPALEKLSMEPSENSIVAVSSYYHSTGYQLDKEKWRQLHGVAMLSDCYPLSKPRSNDMTYEDRFKMISNLFQNVLPGLYKFSSENKPQELSATCLLFFQMIANLTGSDGSLYLVPVYHKDGSLVSLRYASSIQVSTRVPHAYITPEMVYKYMNGGSPIGSAEYPLGSTEYPVKQYVLPKTTIEQKNFMAENRITSKFEPTLYRIFSYLHTHPPSQSTSPDLVPEELPSILLPMMIPYFMVFSRSAYPGSHC